MIAVINETMKWTENHPQLNFLRSYAVEFQIADFISTCLCDAQSELYKKQ